MMIWREVSFPHHSAIGESWLQGGEGRNIEPIQMKPITVITVTCHLIDEEVAGHPITWSLALWVVYRFWSLTTYAWGSDLPLPGCVTSSKWFISSAHQLPHIKNTGINPCFAGLWWGFSARMHVECWAHSRPFTNDNHSHYCLLTISELLYF